MLGLSLGLDYQYNYVEFTDLVHIKVYFNANHDKTCDGASLKLSLNFS